MSFHPPGFEECLGEFSYDLRIVGLAAEHIEIGGVGLIGKMGRDQGSLNELGHGESRHPFIFAEVNHLGFPEAFHLDEVAKLDHKPSNSFRVSDGPRITMIKVDGS